MDEDSPKPTGKQASTAAEASLNAALSDLERMLEQRQSPGRSTSQSPGRGAKQGASRTPPPGRNPAQREGPPGPAPEAGGDGAQFTIPLLHDVVVPGADAASVRPSVDRRASDVATDDVQADEACVKILERLASEIEVIVQARIEAAAQDAASRIRTEIRTHLEIVLPEIIEELKDLTRERR